MRTIIKNILFTCACMLTISCGRDNIDEIIDRAENIIDGQPDSALILLDSVENMITTPKQQVLYSLLSIYARDLNGEDISTDKRIIYVIEYLKKINNSKYRALADYCMGRVYHAQGNLEQAMKFYLNARENAENSDNDNIKGLIHFRIGQIYCNLKSYEEAIDSFKSALRHFNKSKDSYKIKIPTLNMIANCFLIKKKNDSAMIYYNESLKSAEIAQDSADIIQNLGNAYLQKNEFSMAKSHLFQALKLNSDSALQCLIYLNISTIYYRQGIVDSAEYFAKLSLRFAKTVRNEINSAFASIYHILLSVKTKKGDYKAGYEYANQYKNFLLLLKDEIHSRNMLEVEITHKLNVSQNRQALRLRYCIVALLCLCSAAGIIVFFCIKRIRKTKRKLTKTQSEMSENEKSTDTKLGKLKTKLTDTKTILEKTRFRLNEKENFGNLHREILMEIYKAVNILETDPKYEKSSPNNIITNIKSVFIKRHQWANIYDAEKSVFDKIKELYSQLNDTEYKIACLEYLGYSNFGMSYILNMTSHTILQSKTKIRKKINVNSESDIGMFIAENMESDNKAGRESEP